MSNKLTAEVTLSRLKIAIALLAITLLVIDAIQSRSIGSFGWAMLVIYWSWPETKTTSKEQTKVIE